MKVCCSPAAPGSRPDCKVPSSVAVAYNQWAPFCEIDRQHLGAAFHGVRPISTQEDRQERNIDSYEQ
jgi:hypothetical protein